MKIGMRKPSLKKSLKARTTGKAKREIKKALIPEYGKKGRGVLDPKKAVKNKIYKKLLLALEIYSNLNANSKKIPLQSEGQTLKGEWDNGKGKEITVRSLALKSV